MKELSEIQSPFIYLEELDKKSGALLRAGESLVSNGEWESLPEYGEEIKQIVKEFERVPVLLKQTHERILEDQRRREQERLAEEGRQRNEREEQRERERQYSEQIATFRTAYAAFVGKPNWQNTNSALSAGEAVEANPLFPIDARAVAIGTQLASVRSKHAHLIEVREAAKELLAEQAQAGEQS